MIPLRALEQLSYPMYVSYKNALEAEAKSKTPSVISLAFLGFLYNSGYQVLEDPVQADKYLRQAAILATEKVDKGFVFRGIFLSLYYVRDWNLSNPLEIDVEISWTIDILSRRIVPDDASSADSSKNLAWRIRDAISILNDESKRRTLTLWYSAYEIHHSRKSVPRFEVRNRPATQDYPKHQQPQWLKALLQDEPFAFEFLLGVESLPSDLQLSHEPGRTNMIRFCAENMLPRILKHLIAEHGFDVDKKLDSGWKILQEALEQGHNDRVFMLLDCGANAKSMVEKDFVKHIAGDGNSSAINLWTSLKRLGDHLVWSRNSNFLLFPHLRESFGLFNDFDMSARFYESSGRSVSPIYFSILENSWLTFVALLQFGVKLGSPCMAQLNPLQAAIVLVRPLFVATLLETEPTLQELRGPCTASVLHLASLGKHCFTDERKWVYGREEEIKGLGANPQNDEPNHQRVTLKLLLGQTNSEVDKRDITGFTPFLLAVLHGNILAAEVLLQAGADPTLRTFDGFSAAHVAMLSDDPTTIEFVATNWPDLLESRNILGDKPLHVSARLGHYGTLETLLKYRTDIKALDVFGRTALQLAVDRLRANNFVIIARSIYQTVGQGTLHRLLNTRDYLGRSCYHSICKLRNTSALESLYPLLFSFYKRSAEKAEWTPLHFAAVNAPHLICYLMEKIDINARGSHGLTPMHLAYIAANTDSIDLLTQNGGDDTIKDDLGRFPQELLPQNQTHGWNPDDILAAMDDGIRKRMAEMTKAVLRKTRKDGIDLQSDDEDQFRKMYLRDYIQESVFRQTPLDKSASANAGAAMNKCLFCSQEFPLGDHGDALSCRWDFKARRQLSDTRSGIFRRESRP